MTRQRSLLPADLVRFRRTFSIRAAIEASPRLTAVIAWCSPTCGTCLMYAAQATDSIPSFRPSHGIGRPQVFSPGALAPRRHSILDLMSTAMAMGAMIGQAWAILPLPLTPSALMEHSWG